MRPIAMVGLVVAAIAACAFAWSSRPSARAGEPREVVLVARAMVFTAPGVAKGPNPTLRFRAGERVRLVLENRDPGMKHDVTAPGLGFRTAVVEHGETARGELTVPRTPGEYDYYCSFHDRLMRGRMVVQ